MAIQLGDVVPDFTQDSTEGPLHFYDWVGDSWVVLFSHPKDFTPVCTTELGAVAKLKPEFEKRGVKVIGLSVDPTTSHAGWAKDIEETQGHKVTYPMIGDRSSTSPSFITCCRPTPERLPKVAPRPRTPPCVPCS